MTSKHDSAEGSRQTTASYRALAAALLQRQSHFWPRFLSIYARLRRLPRGWRRRFHRKAAATKVATTLAGIALLLALGRAPVGQVAFALDIDVDDGVVIVDDTDELCSLREAIINANDGGQTYDDCGPGSPYADTIRLPPNGNFTIESSFAYDTALPPITSEITIEGDGSTIQRDPNNANPFRLLAVSSSGDLTLNELNLSGGLVSGGGGAIVVEGTATITNSTISGNTAVEGGGVHSGNNSIVTITNSTISGNTAALQGGGIGVSGGNVTLNNSTVTGNTAVEGLGGGGIFLLPSSTVTLNRSIVSGNSAEYGREVGLLLFGTPGKIYADNFNILGEKSSTNAQAFYNFYPGASDITATSNGTTPTYLSAILHPTLAANGGPTKTHALVANSPAIDVAPNVACTAAPVNNQDQRGKPRNENGDGSNSPNECDIGAVEGIVTPIYMTAAGPGTTKDGVNFGKEDILEIRDWERGAWEILFDGVDAGLTPKHDINAIHVNAADDLYLSFFQNKIKTANLGPVHGQDILHYDGSSFSLFFDGSDVGLTTVGEKVDALHILDGSFAPVGGCDYYLLISTLGTGRVPTFSGGSIKFQGEDILGFCMTNTGDDTAGTWHLVLDGSAEGMPKNSTDSISANEDGSVIYLTTQGVFNVGGAFGGHSMVYKFENGAFSGPHFRAPASGLGKKVDGLHVEGDLP